MARAVIFGVLLAVAAPAAPADMSPSRDTSPARDASPARAKTGKAAPADTAAPAAKPAKADTAAKAKPAQAAPAVSLDPQSAYESLLQERSCLEREKKVLEWEEGLAEASLQDSAAYLVIDLDHKRITAKLGGVPMRNAPIMWRYERPGQAVASGIFQVAERAVEAPPNAQPLPQLVVGEADTATARTDSAKGDSARIDSSLARLAAIHHGGPAPRQYDPQRSYCISLQGGPDLCLATLPPTQTWMDTLEVRLRIWLRDFPAVVQHRQSIHLFLAPEDNYWIYAMAVLGARVLVIPPS